MRTEKPEIMGPAPGQSRVSRLALLLIKVVVLPFRFAWLLVVWVRLRRSAS